MTRTGKVWLLLMFLLACPGLYLSGQQFYPVVIRLMDTTDSLSISSAKVIFIGLNGDTITSAITDQQGRCTIRLIDSLNNKVRLHTNPSGFNAYVSSLISFPGPSPSYCLTKKTIQLAEVNILQRQLTKDGGKLLYKVGQDQFSAAVSAPELLEKLPGVIVVNGKLKLNGQEGALILIDGKGENRGQQQQLSILAGLSSNQIDKIEVISIPSARYDANVTAIINIITKKEKSISNIRAGYSQPLFMTDNEFGVGYASGTTSANINFKLKGIKAMLILNTNNTRTPEQKNGWYIFNSTLRYNFLNKSATTVFKVSPDLTLDYDINTRSSVGINLNLYKVPSTIIHTTEQYTFGNSNMDKIDSVVNVLNTYRRNQQTIQGTVNYKYLLDKKKKSNLYATLIYSRNADRINNFLLSQSNVDDTAVTQNRFDGKTNILSASLIFSDVIKWKCLSSEFGIKSNTLLNSTSQLFNNSIYSSFRYKEQISSGFFSTRWNLGKWLLTAELRGELLHSTSLFKQTDDEDQHTNRDYFKIYPNLLLQWNVNNDLIMSIGYTKKIRRPFPGDLNPTRRINNAFNNLSGNINFLPAYFNRVEGQLLYKNATATVRYEISSNRRLFVPANDPYSYIATNMGRSQQLGVSLSKSFKPARYLTTAVNVNYAYYWYTRNDLNYYNNYTNLFETNLSNEIQISKKTRFQCSFYYNASLHMEYFIQAPFFTVACTWRQILLKDKLFLNVSVNDPIGVEKNRSRSFYNNQSAKVDGLSNNRSFSFQLVYNFSGGQIFKQQNYKLKNDGEIRGSGI